MCRGFLDLSHGPQGRLHRDCALGLCPCHHATFVPICFSPGSRFSYSHPSWALTALPLTTRLLCAPKSVQNRVQGGTGLGESPSPLACATTWGSEPFCAGGQRGLGYAEGEETSLC